MESFVASTFEQFKYIKKVIDYSDYYVLIVGGRYGSVEKTSGKSFTELEYDYACEKGIPVLAFVHKNPEDLPPEKRDYKNWDKLLAFRERIMEEKQLCYMWSNIGDLSGSVVASLTKQFEDNPQRGWLRGTDETAAAKEQVLLHS